MLLVSAATVLQLFLTLNVYCNQNEIAKARVENLFGLPASEVCKMTSMTGFNYADDQQPPWPDENFTKILFLSF